MINSIITWNGDGLSGSNISHHFNACRRTIMSILLMCFLWWWWCYPTPSEGRGRRAIPRRPNNRATSQNLDQRSKIEVLPKMACRRGSDARQSRRQIRSCS